MCGLWCFKVYSIGLGPTLQVDDGPSRGAWVGRQTRASLHAQRLSCTHGRMESACCLGATLLLPLEAPAHSQPSANHPTAPAPRRRHLAAHPAVRLRDCAPVHPRLVDLVRALKLWPCVHPHASTFQCISAPPCCCMHPLPALCPLVAMRKLCHCLSTGFAASSPPCSQGLLDQSNEVSRSGARSGCRQHVPAHSTLLAT